MTRFEAGMTRAFTLLEILVVVGIVCLLAAILFPVIGRVQALGRRTTCAANLRQLGIALSQYAQDHRTFYPRLDTDTHIGGGCAPWADALFPYVKAEKVFECPSYELGAYKTGCPPDDESNPDAVLHFNGSYSLNIPNSYRIVKEDGGTTIGGYGILRSQSTTKYMRPQSTILLLDGDGNFVSPLKYEDMFHTYPAAEDVSTLKKYGVPDRHEGGANVGFADGHVKWMRLQDLLKQSLWKLNGPE